ncbi:hypothetical protein GPK34_01050 [Secundilactobacillus kimchicus]|uniref:hypothetical protein n=1 Tax=Secundilactobacillus kimchicus TaxID=528209 RepID=UPI001C0286A6|nr:hypothetical protein [Secundilactobacillus kimchicus]MBT9670625.1 hypothetical protein [Secundilactobacillus kimchicus]
MKTSELKKRLDAHNYTCNETEYYLHIYNSRGHVASIAKDEYGSLMTTLEDFSYLSLEEKRFLFEALTDYAATPPDERKDEVRFRVHILKGNKSGYANLDREDNNILVGDADDDWDDRFQTIFTPLEWDAVHGNLPAYGKDNPLFEEVN